MSIPASSLEKLRAAGLVTFRPFRTTHGVIIDGIRVAKPRSTPGNALQGEGSMLAIAAGKEVTTLDAPILELYTNGNSWFVRSHDWVPGPGPGDFVNEWSTVDQAVIDILDFYFGPPARMEAKRPQGP